MPEKQVIPLVRRAPARRVSVRAAWRVVVVVLVAVVLVVGHRVWLVVVPWAAGALVGVGVDVLLVQVGRPRVVLHPDRLRIHDHARFGYGGKRFARRDVVGVDAAGLRLRHGTFALEFAVRDPAVAEHLVLRWISEGPAARVARRLLLVRVATALGAAAERSGS